MDSSASAGGRGGCGDVGRNRVNTVPRELPVLSALNDNRGWNSPTYSPPPGGRAGGPRGSPRIRLASRCPRMRTVSPSTCSANVTRAHPAASQNRRAPSARCTPAARRPRRWRGDAGIRCAAVPTVFRSSGTASAPKRWPRHRSGEDIHHAGRLDVNQDGAVAPDNFAEGELVDAQHARGLLRNLGSLSAPPAARLRGRLPWWA